MCISAILGVGGAIASLAGGAMQANAARRAASAQERAAGEALDLQREQLDQARADSLPWMEAGQTALNQLMGELGISDAAQNGTFESQFTETPGYQFALQQGEAGVMNNLAALGQRGSGSALRALTEFRTGLANQEYNNYLNRLSGVSTGGQTQVNSTNALTGNLTGLMSNTILNRGAAQGSGYMGAANAIGNALSGMTNNLGAGLGASGWGQTGWGGNPNALAGAGWGIPI